MHENVTGGLLFCATSRFFFWGNGGHMVGEATVVDYGVVPITMAYPKQNSAPFLFHLAASWIKSHF